ncbi:MAG: PD40 domain-containing protein [Spirochaetes bacterium]|nr:PD40 domain-containing protein [Spirochaetota bacterium]
MNYAAVILALFIGFAAALMPYGKNKVNYASYTWEIRKTPHFDIYYDKPAEPVAVEVSKILEEGVAKYAKLFDHNLEKIIPVVVYQSAADFQGTHLYPGFIPEATGGFTELMRSRVVIPFTGSYADLRHVVMHELAHAYQFDILYGDANMLTKGFLQSPPLWLMEGLAEYASVEEPVNMTMYVRDGMVSGHMPSMQQLENPYMLGQYSYFIYKGGEAFYHFIDERYGVTRIADIVHTMRIAYDQNALFKFAIGKEAKNLNDEWMMFLKRRYWPDITNYDSLGQRDRRLTEYSKDHSMYNFHPVMSPGGKTIYVLANRNIYSEIIAIDAVTGATVSTIATAGRSDIYDQLQLLNNVFSFSTNGSLFVFGSKAGGGDRINIMTFGSNAGIRHIALPFSSIQYARISPDGTEVVFTGTTNGAADLFILNINSMAVERLTDDRFYESRPAFSPDGKRIIFAANRNDANDFYSQDADIFIYDRATKKTDRIAASDAEERDAEFSPDGTKIVFSSARGGMFNIYIKDLTNKTVYQMTRTYGGAFEPRFAQSGEKIVYSGYEKGAYNVYVMSVDLKNDAVRTSTEPMDRIGIAKTNALPTKDILFGTERTDYGFNLSPDIMMFSLGYSSALGGGADVYVSFADMLNEHQLDTFMQFSYDNYEPNVNGELRYFYLPLRVDLGGSVYHYKNSYYTYTRNEAGYIKGVARVFDERIFGGWALARMPFDRFTRLDFFLNPEFRIRTFADTAAAAVSNLTANVYLAELTFIYDTSLWLWDMLSARDNSRLLVTAQASAKFSSNDYAFYLLFADLRQYFMLLPNMNFALRLAGGKVFGNDRDKKLFRMGGIAKMYDGAYADYVTTVRGYGNSEFTGENCALANIELRFPFIDYLKFGLPFALANIEGVLFSDFGLIWNDNERLNALSWDYKNKMLVFTDMKSSVGLGFRFVVPPLFYFRVDFSGFYNGYSITPIDQWRTFYFVGMKLYDF